MRQQLHRSRQEKAMQMAILGDTKLLGFHPKLHPFLSTSKLHSSGFSTGGSNLQINTKWQNMGAQGHDRTYKHHQCFGISRDALSFTTTNHDIEALHLSAVKMSFFERVGLAWKILFPNPAATRRSNANVAKQRLKMILLSDRCAVSDEAKGKIVSSIVGALSEYVEIEPQDKVQLDVSTDPDLGTVYSVTVPVRRVKPGYHDADEDYEGKIANIEYKDTGESSGNVDVKFNFYLPNEK